MAGGFSEVSYPAWNGGQFRRPEILPEDPQHNIVQTVATQENQSAKAAEIFELGGGSGRTGQVTIQTTATLILVRNDCRKALKVTNLGTVDVFIGFSPSVGVISGDLLVGVKGSFIVIPTKLDVYAIVASGTGSVSFMEISE
jgi:hypothetical protein